MIKQVIQVKMYVKMLKINTFKMDAWTFIQDSNNIILIIQE